MCLGGQPVFLILAVAGWERAWTSSQCRDGVENFNFCFPCPRLCSLSLPTSTSLCSWDPAPWSQHLGHPQAPVPLEMQTAHRPSELFSKAPPGPSPALPLASALSVGRGLITTFKTVTSQPQANPFAKWLHVRGPVTWKSTRHFPKPPATKLSQEVGCQLPGRGGRHSFHS